MRTLAGPKSSARSETNYPPSPNTASNVFDALAALAESRPWLLAWPDQLPRMFMGMACRKFAQFGQMPVGQLMMILQHSLGELAMFVHVPRGQ